MPVTARQKVFLAITFLVLAGLGFAFLKVFVPLLKDWRDTEEDVQGLARTLDNRRSQFNNYSNPQQYIDELTPAVTRWELACNRRAKLFTTTLRKIPADEKTPEFYFTEQLEETRRRLTDKSRRLNIAVPVDMGFSSAIPFPEEVETLLNQMSNGEYVLNLAMDSGVLAVNSFSVSAPIEESGFIQVIPVQIGFVASLDTLKKFLHWCGTGPQYVNVKTIWLKVARDPFGATNFDAQLFLTTTWVQMEKSAAAAAAEPEAAATTRFGRRRGPPGRFGPRGRGPSMRRGPGGASTPPAAASAAGAETTGPSS